MMNVPLYEAAYPYQDDVLSLPVVNIENASAWYSSAFGMIEVDRKQEPFPQVILERDGVQIGFAMNGGDATQDGAAVLVADIHRAKSELEAKGIEIGNLRVDERDGKKYQVFFVVAPDGLCFYFHQAIDWHSV